MVAFFTLVDGVVRVVEEVRESVVNGRAKDPVLGPGLVLRRVVQGWESGSLELFSEEVEVCGGDIDL